MPLIFRLSCPDGGSSSHAFQFLVTLHLLVEFLLHPVKEVGAALVLTAFDVDVEAVAVLRFHAEYLVQERGELFERHVAVVDAAHLVDTVDQFHEVDGVACPLQGRGGVFGCVFGGRTDGDQWRHLGSGKELLHLPHERESLADVDGSLPLLFGEVAHGMVLQLYFYVCQCDDGAVRSSITWVAKAVYAVSILQSPASFIRRKNSVSANKK